jgi:hypothetical protein
MVRITVCVAMPCCMSRSRDAVGTYFGKHFLNRFPNRVTSARLRRKENGVHHLNCYHRRQIAASGGKIWSLRATNCGKSVTAFYRLLPLITTARFSALLTVRGWCLCAYVRTDTARMMVRYVK